MTFQEAIQALETADRHLNDVHFRKRHQGSCIRQTCKDAMTGFREAMEAVREAYKAAPTPKIPAYFKDGVYRLWETGDVIDGYQGLYLMYHQDGASLMHTWTDSASGNLATACIDPGFIRTLKYV